ncbi:hypothetical protein BC940DRAFT_363455 [Gongronella butleri]|nr:hypothetical protein BC940DRAFT_363455 [Gongronella butleri]
MDPPTTPPPPPPRHDWGHSSHYCHEKYQLGHEAPIYHDEDEDIESWAVDQSTAVSLSPGKETFAGMHGCALSPSDLCARYYCRHGPHQSHGHDAAMMMGVSKMPSLSTLEYSMDGRRHRCGCLASPLPTWCSRVLFCGCLPPWLRYTVYALVVSTMITLIVLGGVLGSYRDPDFTVVGFQTADAVGYHLINLIVQVDNPNVFGITFRDINTTAYYSLSSLETQMVLGSGYVDSHWSPRKSSTTFVYPVVIDYTSLRKDALILKDVTLRCIAVPPGRAKNLVVDYVTDIVGTALFVTRTRTISSQMQIPCLLRLT